MTELAATMPTIGAKVATARRNRGMTQREMANAIGVSVWTIDRIENDIVDPRRYLPAIAELTNTSPASYLLDDDVPGRRARHLPAAHLGVVGRDLVLGSIALLVTIRFFTEVFPILPRAANFVDIPIFLALAVAGLSVGLRQPGPAYLRLGLPAGLFIVLAIVSATINAQRAHMAPVAVFIYGFLAPLAVYAAVYRIWPPRNARYLSRLLVALGLLQLAVVALIDLPRFSVSRNPDLISGTFGTNAYQLVVFLLVVAALLAGIFTLEPGRAVARFVPVLITTIFVVTLLAQYRALLATTVITMVVVSVLLGVHMRGLLAAVVAVLAFGLAFGYVASSFPGLRLDETARTLTQNPTTYALERYAATRPVKRLYADLPQVAAIGTGPGTFSSRAWQTFANAESTSSSNVQAGYAQRLTGGVYQTDVSTKYVDPQRRQGAIVEGSRALSSPYSSYLALAAEVGLLGLALILGVYLVALIRCLRIARRQIPHADPSDSVPALALAATVGFLTLLQLGVLENWLEVTRVTFIVWITLAVVTKELDARSEGK